MLRDWVRLMRPLHWVKNVFVLMPLPFALAAGAAFPAGRFLWGLFAFCLANSAVYAFNDAQDAPRDRLHKTKSDRPVAAGNIRPGAARALSGALAALALAVSSGLAGSSAAGIVLAYLGLNAIYTLGAKNRPLVDVFLLSSGFVLRVMLGCALVAVVPSNWLLLCSSSLALFLALAKRRADLGKGAVEYRPVLHHYSLAFLDHAMAIAAGLTLVSYALYSIEAEALRPGREFAALPFVVFGVLDYLRIVTVRGEGADPAETILAHPVLLSCGVGWVAATLWSVRLS